MRLVVDTNILVSAFLWQGTPGRLVELAGEQECQLFTSRVLIDELTEGVISHIPSAQTHLFAPHSHHNPATPL